MSNEDTLDALYSGRLVDGEGVDLVDPWVDRTPEWLRNYRPVIFPRSDGKIYLILSVRTSWSGAPDAGVYGASLDVSTEAAPEHISEMIDANRDYRRRLVLMRGTSGRESLSSGKSAGRRAGGAGKSLKPKSLNRKPGRGDAGRRSARRRPAPKQMPRRPK
jgi:hypothetical protein